MNSREQVQKSSTIIYQRFRIISNVCMSLVEHFQYLTLVSLNRDSVCAAFLKLECAPDSEVILVKVCTPLHTREEVLPQSGVASLEQTVMARYGGLVADPGESGGDRAEPGLGFVVRGGPELHLQVLADALVVEPLVQDATDCQLE